jgi:hypothetical protein
MTYTAKTRYFVRTPAGRYECFSCREALSIAKAHTGSTITDSKGDAVSLRYLAARA